MIHVVGIDSETELIRPGRLAPPLVCVSFANNGKAELVHRMEAHPIVEALLEDDCLLVGHNIAFDMAVLAEEFPDLIPVIFEAYDANRITCTEVREKLVDIGLGQYRGFRTIDEKLVKLNYYLDDVSARRLNVRLEKKNGWRLRYGELRDVPVSFWHKEAIDYALEDALAPVAIYEAQEIDSKFLHDQFRQSRAAFWIQLMSCWGLVTSPEGVREFARKTKLRHDEIAAELQRFGLVRFDGTRNIKKVQERVVRAYFAKSGCLTLQEAIMRGKVPSTGKGQVKTDWDTCELSGDPLLKKYSEFSSLGKTLSTDIPILEKCTSVPLEVNWEVLRETGRTATSPNTQNFPTEIGVRECFTPRPGWVYAIGDYPQIELRTWAQVCLRILNGRSEMAKALNAGIDPHCELGRRMLKPQLSYDEFFTDYRNSPKGRMYFHRQAAKAGNFGFPGGLSAPAYKEYAWSNYGVAIELELAFELRKFWFETWSEAQEYFDWVGNEDPSAPVLQLFSRRLRGRCRFTEACNTLFQGLAADLAKNAGFLIASACYAEPESPLYGSRIVNFIHDEFLVETPDDERAHDAAVELGRLMEVGSQPFIPEVPCKVEPILSRWWSKSAKEVRGPDGRLVPWDFPGGRIAA